MFLIFIFLLGLGVGSLINVIVHRLQTNEPMVFERSHCPDCKTTLRWFDLIPLYSYFQLGGKCRYCGKNISWQYPVVEFITAIVFVWLFMWQFPQYDILSLSQTAPYLLGWQFLKFTYYLVIVSVLIVIFIYDLKHYLILDKILFPTIGLAFVALVLRALNYENWNLLWLGVLAALVGSGFFLLLVLVSRGKWMGLGDVKFAILMGFILGWPYILYGLFVAFMVGAIVGLILIALKKKGMKSEMPFGPFLVLGTLVVLVYGEYLTKLLSRFIIF
jgi:prepilin signal peptidase PulO-like enzyme (type II secretory pathway)